MDAVEELRLALEANDVERAKTLIGPVWNERDGLRRLLEQERSRANSYADRSWIGR